MATNHFFKINIIVFCICFLTVSALVAQESLQSEEGFFFNSEDFIQIAFIYEEETTPNSPVNESSRVEINEKRELNMTEKKYEELKKENNLSDANNAAGEKEEAEKMVSIGYVWNGLSTGFLLGYEQAFNQNENSWNLSIYSLGVEGTNFSNTTGIQFAYLWWLRSFNFMFTSTLKLKGYYAGPLLSLNYIKGEFLDMEYECKNLGIGLKLGYQYSFDNGFSVGLMCGYSKTIIIGEPEIKDPDSGDEYSDTLNDLLVDSISDLSGFMYGLNLGYAF